MVVRKQDIEPEKKYNKERVKALISEFEGKDFSDAKLSEIWHNRKKIRKEIEVLAKERYATRKVEDEEYRQELNEYIKKLQDIRDDMENKQMQLFRKLHKIRVIFSAVALIGFFAWIGFTLLSEGDYELSASVKYATQFGYSNEEIFKAVDTESQWYGGETKSGREAVQVDLQVPLDLDENGINELNDVSIQWVVDEEKYELYALSINGASQNKLVRNMLYSELIQQGLAQLNSSSDITSNNKSSFELESTSQPEITEISYKEIYLFDDLDHVFKGIFDYTLGDIEERCGADYFVNESEEGQLTFISYSNELAPYWFGFSSLEKDSKIENVFIVNEHGVFADVTIESSRQDLIEAFGEPISEGYDDMDDGVYITDFEFEDFSLSFTSYGPSLRYLYAVMQKD